MLHSKIYIAFAVLSLASPAVATDELSGAVVSASKPIKHMVKPPVLLDTNPHGETRRIVRIIKTAPEAPAARKASTSADGKFIYKFGKNTKTKTYRPAISQSKTMPNHYKK